MQVHHRFIRWLVTSSLILSFGQAAATSGTTKPLPYDFKYELHLSEIDCWITTECQGLVSETPNRELAKKIDRHLATAEESINMAIYGIREQDWVLERIGRLRKAGVEIRATIDQISGSLGDWQNTANFPYPDAYKLKSALRPNALQPDRNQDGSPRTGSIMHNKFYVVDGKSVWFGTANFSDTGIGKEYNANTSMIIFSKDVAQLFNQEFEQMFSDGLYSIYKRRHRSVRSFRFKDGTEVSVFFAPQDKPIDAAVVPFIDKARSSLTIGIFYLTSGLVKDALIAAHRRGIDIKIINDATAARHKSSIVKPLRHAGIDVRVENWGGKMHMKTAVADGKHTLIGSMNWSDAGNISNDESVVVIRNNRGLARQVEGHIQTLWDDLPNSLSTPNYRDPRAESLESINSCFDGINNDHQGGTDMDVPACRE